MEPKIRHLEMIQGVINRMARSSFLIKGWTVTLVAAMFALAASNINLRYIIISYFPAIIFWVADGFYLHQERLFRALYDYVRAQDDKSIDFSMDTSPFRARIRNWPITVFSRTLLLFYGAILVLISVIHHVLS